MLTPNIMARKLIIAWREQHGLPALSFGQPVRPLPPGPPHPVAPFIMKPAAVCAFSQKPLQVYCVTCRKSICIKCLSDPARCKSHNTCLLDDILSGIRDTHAAWVQVLEGQPQQLQARRSAIASQPPPMLPCKLLCKPLETRKLI